MSKRCAEWSLIVPNLPSSVKMRHEDSLRAVSKGPFYVTATGTCCFGGLFADATLIAG